MKIKFSAFIILACLLIFSGCANENDNAVTTTANANDNNENPGEIVTETEKQFLDNLPADLDFNGADITFLVRSEDPWGYEISVDAEDGEIINDAIYTRNRTVAERLNVNINTVKKEGLWEARDGFITAVRSDVLSDAREFDVIAGYQYYMMNLITEGIFYNMYDLPYIEVDQPYWAKNISDTSTVNGKMYAITGDLALSLLEDVVVIYFNKTLIANNGLDDPYEIVMDGKWTVDKLEEMSKNIYTDVNGDGVRDKEDIFGMILTNGNFVNQFARGFEIPIINIVNGQPEIYLGNDKTVQFFDRMMALLYNNVDIVGEADSGKICPVAHSDVQVLFKADQVLFLPATLSYTNSFRDMESDYGIIPLPKWNETQKDYLTSSTDACTMFFVPISCNDINVTSATLEALCALSSTTVKHSYYEVVLKTKYSRDDVSHIMLDLCTGGIIFDFAQLYSSALSDMGNVIKSYISNKSNNNYMSYYASQEVKFQEKLDGLMEFFN